MLTVLAAATIATAVAWAAGDGTERRDATPGGGGADLVCEQLVADSCGTRCPCLFGEAPHHGACRFASAFEVRKGTIDGELLKGARFAIAGEFHGATRDKPPLDLTKMWIDPASTTPAAALKLGTFFNHMAGAKAYVVTMAPIKISRA